MNHAKDKSPLPLPAVLNEDLAVSSQKRVTLVNSHIVHIHADPILCNSVASTSFCKTHPNHSDKHSIQVNSNATAHTVDGHSGCQDGLSAEVCRLENSAACSDSEEDRPGSFDYMPKQKGHVRVMPAINPSYDEEVKLDSSAASSVVESPRSDDGGHAEENLLVTELVKKTRRKHKHTCWHYTPHHSQKSDDDEEDEDTNDDDDEEDSGNHNLDGAISGSSIRPAFPRTVAVKEVDEGVSYNLKPLNGPSAGQLTGPDAGQGHQLDLPLPYSLYQDMWMSEDGKEKDKKRGRSKDDTDKPEATGPVDINGNPRLLDPAIYPQMRPWPGSKFNSTASGSLPSLTPLTISHSHASAGADANAFDRKKERRRMKLERLKGTPAEEIKGHRKFSDIREILAFVEGTNTSKGEGKSGKKKHERSRKKDHPDGPHSLEDTAGADDVPDKEESFVVTSVQPVARAMGNSFRSFDESISKSLSEDEEVDKNNGEFHDCLSAPPAEPAAPNGDSQQKLNGSLLGRDKTSPDDANWSAVSAEDSKTDKHLTDGAEKKSIKSKTKKEKLESVGGDNGHLISKSSAGKGKDSLERKDSLLLSSVLCAENAKSETHLGMKREDSFTEVKKKKKRPGVKDVHTVFPGYFSKSYNNSHGSSGTANYKFQHRTSTPSPQPPAVLPGCSQIVALPVGSQTHTLRDLSPSAFPVLSGQGQPLGLQPEARRNSCGDLNSDSLDNRTYDSDRESAKSLPAAHGAIAGGDILPSYPLSYARIAAAPRKNDNTGNPSLDSSVASIPQNTSIPHPPVSSVIPSSSSNPAVTPERKTTVWKGSPRERRHSIGSSPKDKVEDGNTSVAEKNRQCGSQEVLSKSTVSSASKTAKPAVAVSVSVIRQVHADEDSGSSHHIPTSAQTQAVLTAETVAAELTDTCTSIDAKAIPQTGKTNIAVPNAGSPEYAISSSLCKITDSAELHPFISSQSIQASAAHKNVDTELIARKSTHDASILAFSTQSQTLASAETISKTVVNNNNIRHNCHTDAVRKNPKKSVIFLDKRFESAPPQNLGITFGFDSSYESSSDTASQPARHRQPQPPFPPPPHHQPPPAAAVTAPPPCFPSSSLPPAASSVSSPGEPHIPPAPHPAAAAVVSATNTLLFISSPPPAQYSDHSKPVPKGPHIRGPCNGIVFTSRSANRASDDRSQIIRDNNNSGRGRSSYSVSSQEITSVGRTSSCSGETDNVLVTSGTHNKVPSGDSPAVDQQNTSLPHTAVATCADRNCSETPPPPHAAPAEAAMENSGLSSPSTQDKPEVARQCHGVPELTELGLRDRGEVPSASAREAADTAPSVAAETASQQQQKQDVGDLPAVPVVYGLKIKSGAGCGKLMFVPSSVSKKNRGNSEELVSFLRRRWLEITQKPGSATFITLSYSEGSL